MAHLPHNTCIFYNTYHTQVGLVLLPTHTINLSFDWGSHECFSAVRLVIVTDPNDPNESVIREKMIMNDWPRPILDLERRILKFNLKGNSAGIFSVRNRYLQHQRQMRTKFSEAEEETVPTIILELTQSVLPYFDTSRRYYVLKPYLPKNPADHFVGPGVTKGDPKILYDRTLAVDAEHRSRFIKLTWGQVSEEDGIDLSMIRQHLGYHIRVLPLKPTQPLKHLMLPPSIIRTIVDYASHWVLNSAWPKTILSCALVNKSWLHLLSIFWGRVKGGIRVPNLKGLVRSLELQPQNAPYVTHFHMHQLPLSRSSSEDGLEDGDELDLVASKTILPALFRSATSLKIIEITVPMFEVCKQDLALLNHVQDFALSRSSYQASDPRYATYETDLLISDVLEVSRRWKDLKALSMKSWGVNNFGYISTGQSIDPHDPVPVDYSLEMLAVSNIKISGDDLLHVVSNSGQTLSYVFLNAITLPRRQFFAFLLQICSHLEQLKIHRTYITPDTSSDEGPILDVLISQMIRLKHLSISPPLSPIITNNGIARKQSAIVCGVLEVDDYPITAIPGTASEMSLAKALEEGNWKEIRLNLAAENYIHYAANGVDMEDLRSRIAELKAIAEQKETVLTIIDHQVQ